MDTIFSDEKLAELRALAVKASPFPSNYGTDFKYNEGDYEERKANNGALLVAVKEYLPALIDELMELRNGWTTEETENESDMMTIYEGEVHITNNYFSIDPEQYIQYKEQLREEWMKELSLSFKDNWEKNE